MPTECPWCSYDTAEFSGETGVSTANGNILNVGMLTAEVGIGGNGEPREQTKSPHSGEVPPFT